MWKFVSEVLVHLLEVINVVLCCYSLSKAESNCLEVMELCSLPRLVKLLSSEEKVVRSYAVLCLASMVGNGQQQQPILVL